jgi:hypothetical protein
MTAQLGSMFVLGVVFFLIVLVIRSRLPGSLRLIVAGGLIMRVVGTLAMLAIIFGVYRGVADANGYFNRGLLYWERMLAGDFGMITNRIEWAGGQWWGAHFMYVASAPVAGILGEGRFGAFLLAALLGYAGLCLVAVAFHRCYPRASLTRYALWLFFFPSLWLWPSVLGKEAVVMLGMGLLVFGFCRPGRVAWTPTVSGLMIIFCIRPQVAAVFIFCMILAEWLARGQRWTSMRVAQTGLIVAGGTFLIIRGLALVGVGEVGMEGVGDYLEYRARHAESGGTAAERTGKVGIGQIPSALVLTLFRPFPWEATNPITLATSAEIWLMWGMMIYRWRRVVEALRDWRGSRFLAMGLPFVLLYSAAFGMIIVNMGIVARQRIFLFPFLFALMEGARVASAAPRPVPRARPAPARQPAPLPPALPGPTLPGAG